ncbi:GNAT family N-acetyltransferase [Streptomyces sp. NBC_00448]|uniref:GNAT family N-acetyltransferase n=1 Tax=Streptomyces sp. NBC_00448 TaxID=2903652 RepID=UPI002E1ABA10
MVRIRTMTEPDVPAVSAIRVRGWQHAYAGMVPQSHLDAMDPADDAARRREWFVRSAGRVHNLVAEEAAADGTGPVIGWAAFGPYRGEDTGATTGELYALYVRPDRIGTGAGRALTAEVVRRSAELGRTRLALWVLTDNVRARRFYAAAGFSPDGATMTELYDGVPVEETRYTRSLP